MCAWGDAQELTPDQVQVTEVWDKDQFGVGECLHCPSGLSAASITLHPTQREAV